MKNLFLLWELGETKYRRPFMLSIILAEIANPRLVPELLSGKIRALALFFHCLRDANTIIAYFDDSMRFVLTQARCLFSPFPFWNRLSCVFYNVV